MNLAPNMRVIFRMVIGLAICGLSGMPERGDARTIEAGISQLWTTYHTAPAAPQASTILLHISQEYRLLGEEAAADSVTDMMFHLLRMGENQEQLITIMHQWFASRISFGTQISPFRDTQRIAGYTKTIMSLARQNGAPLWISRAWYARAILEMSKGRSGSAAGMANKAYYYASLSPDVGQKISALQLLGICEQNQQHRLDAFRHYMDALYLARATNDDARLVHIYDRLFFFYYSINNYEKAEEYLYKIFPLLRSVARQDSTQYMYHAVNLAMLQCSRQDYEIGLATARQVLNYCRRVHNHSYMHDLLTVLRSLLIEQGQYRRLSELYREDHPEEWQRVAREEPVIYYQLKAAFTEADSLPDSSGHYYRLAEQHIIEEGRGAGLKAFFYRRYGQAMLRWGKTGQARPLLDTALHYSKAINYLPYMAEISGQLDSLLAGNNDLAGAYPYARLHKQYGDALASANRQDEILMLDMENEQRSRELQVRQEAEHTRHRHNIQYMAITILIGFSFLLLLLLGSFKVPQWAITAMGFFSFIFLFEFIILIIDHKVHALTHGEPWKILVIKIFIIAGLLPLHHWTEHKVVHYLHTHKLINPRQFSIRMLFRKLTHGWKRSAVAKHGTGLAEELPD